MPGSDSKLPLPTFLKVLSNGGMAMPKAMAAAAKIYKTCNTPKALAALKDLTLKQFGIDDKEDRKQVLAAVKKAGFKGTSEVSGTVAEGSKSPYRFISKKQSPSPRKRRRDNDGQNELLPTGPPDEGSSLGSLEFNENLDEDVLTTKSVVVNRAPVMTAWATVVAERLGFKREEALSIASAYTEMNAISKGVSIGVFDDSKGKGVDLKKGDAQPFVDFMGRRPVFTTQSGDWRALVKGQPILPSIAYSYITRAFRQTLPFVMGALRLLATSYSPTQLNAEAFSLYSQFRPAVNKWGGRSEVRCDTILALRRKEPAGTTKALPEETADLDRESAIALSEDGPSNKRSKVMTLEEYEASLDNIPLPDDLTFEETF
ncbi:hypothetical protein BD410DRAFT_709803 [Rickenella mellea]|uniref:Uncharacterized protein n=1 Tax=Rickenella mellea TaxID=50990 RepID=A0A4R5XEN4_9AGAM|nr:hypothetical protein BD410DRAFT_709803 [Rickenella mellea]